MACGISVLGQGTKPVSPALAGGFPNTGPPEKSCNFLKDGNNEVNYLNLLILSL